MVKVDGQEYVRVGCYICEYPLGWVVAYGHKLWLCEACAERGGGERKVTAIDVEYAAGEEEPVERESGAGR